MIVVRSWGIAGSLVGAGHLGRAWLGQSRGGAVDLRSHALANRLVGNAEQAGAIETSGGLELELPEAALVAITGAVAEWTVLGGPPVGWGVPVVLPAGARLRGGRLLAGARSYLAVRGGLVEAGTGALEVDALVVSAPATHPASRAEPLTTVRVWPGPRRDWFTPEAWHALLHSPYRVADTSRVGVRLVGEPLTRARRGELPSEGLVEGAIQVPPDGQPIVMLADHPTTGGYPVIAVVDPDDLHHLAQAAAGTDLRCTRHPAAR